MWPITVKMGISLMWYFLVDGFNYCFRPALEIEKKTDCQWLSYCGVGLEHVGTTNQMFQFVKERSEMRCCGFFADVCSFKNAVFRYRKGDVCGQCSFSQKVGIDSQITTSRNKSCLKFFVNGNRSKATDSILLGYLATRHLWYPMIMQGAGPYCWPVKRGLLVEFLPQIRLWNHAENPREIVGNIWEVECTMVKLHGGEVYPFFCAGGVNPCS